MSIESGEEERKSGENRGGEHREWLRGHSVLERTERVSTECGGEERRFWREHGR